MNKIKIIFSLTILCLYSLSAQNKVRSTWGLHTNTKVHFILIDPAGRKTGADPRGAVNRDDGIKYNEIPNTYYDFEGIGNLEGGPDTESRVFYYSVDNYAPAGTYNLDVIGIDLTQYFIDGWIDKNDKTDYRIYVRGAIDRDSVVNYTITVKYNPATQIEFKKVVSIRSVNQDLLAMIKISWINDQSRINRLKGFINNAQIAQSKQYFQTAINELKNFQKEVEPEYLLYKDSTRIKGDIEYVYYAWVSLYVDAGEVIKQLEPQIIPNNKNEYE